MHPMTRSPLSAAAMRRAKARGGEPMAGCARITLTVADLAAVSSIAFEADALDPSRPWAENEEDARRVLAHFDSGMDKMRTALLRLPGRGSAPSPRCLFPESYKGQVAGATICS